jgi:acetyl-CoA C-acetyltransferase
MADAKGYTREDTDNCAISSLKRAQRAVEQDSLEDEIVPVTAKTREGNIQVEHD